MWASPFSGLWLVFSGSTTEDAGCGVAELVSKLLLNPTLTHQNLLFCRVPINSILGCIIRTDKSRAW